METLVVVLLIVAVVIFALAAFSRRTWPVNLTALGLAFVAGALLAGHL